MRRNKHSKLYLKRRLVVLFVSLAFLVIALVAGILFFPRSFASTAKTCSLGAYHKKGTATGEYIGIGGTVRLGNFKPDKNRYKDFSYNSGKDKVCKSLDAPSIYIGIKQAISGREIDVGLNWEISRDGQGILSKTQNSYRPFWRTTSWHSAPAEARYTWQSGDMVNLEIEIISDGEVKFTVTDRNNSSKKFQTVISVPGLKIASKHEAKLITSIDQYGREGKKTAPTSAELNNLQWSERYLIKSDGQKVAFNSTNEKINECMDKNITVAQKNDASGAETISIRGDSSLISLASQCKVTKLAQSGNASALKLEQVSGATKAVKVTNRTGKAKPYRKYRIVSYTKDCTIVDGKNDKCGDVDQTTTEGEADSTGQISLEMALYKLNGEYFIGKKISETNYRLWWKSDIVALDQANKSLGKITIKTPLLASFPYNRSKVALKSDEVAKSKFTKFIQKKALLKIK